MKYLKIMLALTLFAALFVSFADPIKAGGGTQCGAGCTCSNFYQGDVCDQYDSCTTTNNGTGSTGKATYNGGCGSGRGTHSHDYTCFNGPCSGGACFVPGTIVSNSSGGKPIEEVQVGDSVDSFVDGVLTKSIVNKIYKVSRDYYYQLVAGDREGRPYNVRVTAEHPFYIGNDQFEEVQNLRAGDGVYVMENKSLVKKTELWPFWFCEAKNALPQKSLVVT